MILVTGASGKTGQAIISRLLNDGHKVVGFARSSTKIDNFLNNSNFEYRQGNLDSTSDLEKAIQDVNAIYHICPNVHPKEFEFGKRIIDLAKSYQIKHFVFHSVIYPQIKAMPHHWEKLLVEEYLINSGIPFTILQPTAYMENILGQQENLSEKNIYLNPYKSSSKSSLIALSDLVEVISNIILNEDHFFATYPLTSEDHISSIDIANTLSIHLNRKILPKSITPVQWKLDNKDSGISDYGLETLEKMFSYYENHGLVGNHQILKNIIDRNPTSLKTFLHRSNL